VFCVRVDAPPGDQNKFQTSVPTNAERQLLVRTPARSIHFKNEDKYHRDGYCSVTRNIHLAISEDSVNDPRREWVYYLLQFPKEVTLDNAVMSQDMQEVVKRKVGVKYSEDETGIRGIISNAMVVTWEIAERAAGTRLVAQNLYSNNDSDAFA
jgi:hypothetical protein